MAVWVRACQLLAGVTSAGGATAGAAACPPNSLGTPLTLPYLALGVLAGGAALALALPFAAVLGWTRAGCLGLPPSPWARAIASEFRIQCRPEASGLQFWVHPHHCWQIP